MVGLRLEGSNQKLQKKDKNFFKKTIDKSRNSCYNVATMREGKPTKPEREKEMKLYVLIVNNGEYCEDYEDKNFGVFSSYEEAVKNGEKIINNKEEIVEKMYENDDFGFSSLSDWSYRIEELELNKTLY